MKPFKYPAPRSPEDDASLMPSIEGKKILMGFWHNWPPENGAGYEFGKAGTLALEDVPEEYNVVAVAFMKGRGIPTFVPVGYSVEEFRRQVGVLNKRGCAVLLSLGGADGEVELEAGSAKPLANEIIRLCEVYGFDGLDIDLEQGAIDAASNQSVIPAALIEVHDYYKSLGKHFIISMAPEFPYLRTSGKYVPYLVALEGYYDFIAPQFYNQGGDGVAGPEGWLGQNDDTRKEDFLYYLTLALVTGQSTYTYIPADKFVIGLPTNNDAARTGWVIDPKAVYNAFDRLEAAGHAIKGLMTWSVHWDCGTDKNGLHYNWGFKEAYRSLIHGGNEDGRPWAPRSLHSIEETETTIALMWMPPANDSGNLRYDLYRKNSLIMEGTPLISHYDTALTPNTTYQYWVVAIDQEGRRSPPSVTFSIKTKGDAGEPSYPQWSSKSQLYRVGDGVTYSEKKYTCINEHTSNEGWTPEAAFTLWAPAPQSASSSRHPRPVMSN